MARFFAGGIRGGGQRSNAANNTLYTSYDLLGRAAKQWQALGQARLDSNTDLDWGAVFKIMDYDAVGQLVGVNSSGATGTLGSPDGAFNLTRSTSAFNAFGEAVQKSVNGAVVQAARYDNLGRTWLTNADDGSYKAVFYDVQGNVTTTLRSDIVDGAAGSLVTFNSAQEVAAVQGQFIRTDTQYDLMGRMIRANAPGSNVYQRNDRWGNLIERTDPRNANWSVKYTYNWRNELLEEVNVVKTAGGAGYTETVAKAVSTFYDELGRQVGMRDANMNASGTGRLTKTMTYDLQGLMLAEYHADGGLTSSAYNLFGDRTMVTVQVTAEQANTTRFGYDHLSHLIDTWTAPVETYYLATPTDASDMHLTGLGAVELHLHYDYDSIGNRYQTIASDGGVTRARYDLDGNVVGTRDPVGIVVQYSFDAQHHRTGQLNGDGLWMNWQYDVTGKLVSHVDLGGATVTYGYDGRGQLVSQTSTVRGGTGSAQDIVSTYDATGLLLSVDDRTSGIRTTYTYDLAGNRTGEKTEASSRNTGALIPNGPQSNERTAVTELYWAVSGHGPDAGGLDFWVWHMQEGTGREEIVDRFFDEADINALYPPDVDFATSLYKNALNRLPTAEEAAIVNNALAGGASRGEVVVDFIDGMSAPGDVAFFDGRVNTSLYFPNDSTVPDYGILAQNNTNVYDNLGRISDITDGKYTVNFTYDANGNRIQVHTHYDDEQGTVDTVAVNTFDVMDRQLMVNGTRDADGNVVIGTFGHLLTYDLVGNRTTDTYLGDTAIATSVTRERFDYDALGRLTFTHRTANGTSDEYQIDARKYDMGSRIIESGVGSGLTEETINALEAMDIETNSRLYYYDLAGKTLRQKIFDGEGGTPNAGKLQDIFYYSSSSQDPNGNDSDIGYDAAGNLKGYYIVPQGGSDGDQVVYRMTYAHFDGYVQTKLSVTRGDGSKPEDYRETNSTYNQNGFLVQVQVGDDPAPRTFINDIDGHILRKTSGEEVTTTLIVNGEVFGSSGGPRDAMVGYFATNYVSTTESGAATAPTVYMAEEGDTLQSIARSIWGDAQLWYLIADANGIAGDAELKAGDQLVIPPKVNTVNSNYQAYKPYDPSHLIGDTTPVLPAPTGGGGGGGGGGCGILGAIISIFVAVVAFTVLLPVGAAVASGLTLSGTAAAMVTYGVAGALASVVSQGVGIAIGTQDSFSWKSVAVAGLSAGLMQGVDATLIGGTALAPTYAGLGGVGGVIARAAISNAMTQGLSIAVGLQSSFNWRSLAASSAAAGVGHLVETNIDADPGSFGVMLAGEAASSVTQQLIQNGRVSAATVASDAFGNALGRNVAASLKSDDPLGDFIKKNEAKWAQKFGSVSGNTMEGMGQSILSVAVNQKAVSILDFLNNDGNNAIFRPGLNDPTFLPVSEVGGHFTEKQLTGQAFVGAINPRTGEPFTQRDINILVAYSQFGDQLKDFDATSAGLRFFSSEFLSTTPLLVQQAQHSLNGETSDWNLQRGLDLVRENPGDLAIAGMALHFTEDGIPHLGFISPAGHAAENLSGHGPDPMSPELAAKTQPNSIQMFEAITRVSADTVIEGQEYSIRENAQRMVTLALDQAGIDGATGEAFERNFNVVARNLLPGDALSLPTELKLSRASLVRSTYSEALGTTSAYLGKIGLDIDPREFLDNATNAYVTIGNNYLAKTGGVLKWPGGKTLPMQPIQRSQIFRPEPIYSPPSTRNRTRGGI